MKTKVILIAIPLLIFFVLISFAKQRGPFHWMLNMDPDYAYLLNSLQLAQGLVPSHIDHPGTTVQELGAATIQVVHWVRCWTQVECPSVEKDVVSSPETYLSALSLVVRGALVVFLFVIGFHCCRRYGAKAAIALQLSVLIPAGVVFHLVRVGPEALLVFASVGSAYLAFLGFESSGSLSRKSMVRAGMLGLALGFGLATKLTFLPLLLAPIFVFWGADLLIAYGVFALSTGLFLLPILSKLRAHLEWIGRLLTHAGKYGSGEAKIISITELPSVGLTLFEQRYGIFLAIGLLAFLLPYLMYSLRKSKGLSVNPDLHQGSTRLTKYLLGLTIVSIAQIALVLKHPGPFYLLPGVCFLTTSLVLILFSRRSSGFDTFAVQVKNRILLWCLALLALNGITDLNNSWRIYADMKAGHEGAQELLAKMAQKENCRTISFYPASSQSYGVYFGNTVAGGAYTKEAAASFPDFINFDIWGEAFNDFSGLISLTELVRNGVNVGECFLLVGGKSFGTSGFVDPPKSLMLKSIYEHRFVSIYRIVTFRK